MKRKIASVLCCTLAFAALAACGQNKNEPGTEKKEEANSKIVIATNMTNIVDTTLADMAEEFMEANPGTTIEYEAIKDYESVIATRVASGEAPDIYIVIDGMTTDNMDAYFMPLDDLDVDWDNIYFSRDYTAADGHVYAIADSVNYGGIVYNKAAFQKAGIEEVPQTAEEFMGACEKLKAAGITPLGTAFKDVWPIYPWVSWSMAQIAINGNEEGQNAYIDNDEVFDGTMAESMGFIRRLYQNGYLEEDIMSANWDQLKVDLSSGNTAMFYSESWLPAQIVEGGADADDVGMFPYPGAKGIYVTAGKSYGISKDCENPELALKYLKFMIEEGRNAIACSTLPAQKDCDTGDQFVEELLSYGIEPIECAAAKAEFGNRKNEIELDEQSLLMTYVMENDDTAAQAILDEWNAKWAAAR